MTRLDRVKVSLAAGLIRGILALLGATWRWRVVGGERLEELLAAHRAGEPRPVVLAYWHNRSLILARFLTMRLMARGYPLALLSSLSRDGELGAKLARAWGGTVFRGSASRGGTQGLRRLFRHLKKGGSCILAPDGPRGPLYEAKAGAVVLSQMTGVPVIPLSAAADRCWRLRSWDRLILPRPFARVLVTVGEPEAIPAGDLERGKEILARRLDRVREEAERAVVAGSG